MATTWRLWRLKTTAAVSGNLLELREIELRIAGVDQTAPVTTQDVTWASEEFGPSNTARNAWDGTNNTWAGTNTATFPKIITYDFGLGNEKAIDAIAINPAASPPKDFTVECSNDGVNWYNAATQSGLTTGWTAGTLRVFTVTAPTTVAPVTNAVPVIQNVSTVTNNTDSSTITFNKPSGLANGDLLVVFLSSGESTTTSTAPSNTTPWVQQQFQDTGTAFGAVFTKLVTNAAGEPSTYAFTQSTSRRNTGGIYRISGADPITPIAASAKASAAGNATAHIAPSVTSAIPGSLLLCAAIGGWGNSYSYTPPVGMTEDFDVGNTGNTSDATTISGAHRNFDIARPTLTRTFTCSASIHWVALSLLISPATIIPPTVTSVTPSTGDIAGGTPVTIVGDNFTGVTGVDFDGNPATSVVVVDDEHITCNTPSGSVGLVDIDITNPDDTYNFPSAFTYTTIPPPTFVSITPDEGTSLGGDPVTITGTNFTGATGVTFDGVSATSFVVVNSTTITCVTPAGTIGLVDVVVQHALGDATGTDAFEYIFVEPAARITQIPIIVVNLPVQDTLITQIPLIVLNLPVQGTKITQAPVVSLWTPPPTPLPAPIVPDVPLTETWSWKTVIHAGDSGQEQRAALRRYPRYGMTFDAIILTDAERRDVYQMLFNYIKQTFLYPMYHYPSFLSEAAGAADTKLYFDPTITDIRSGEYLAIFDPHTVQTTYHLISTVDVDGATLANPVGVDVSAKCQVCPAVEFRFPGNPSINMASVSGGFSVAMESVNPRVFKRPGDVTAPTTWDGYVVFDKTPLTNEDIEESFDHGMTWLDNGVAPPIPETQQRIPFITGSRQYHALRSDLAYWRSVMDTLRGSRTPFLLPSFHHDMPLTEQPALGATHLISSNIQLIEFWLEKTYQRLRIVTTNGIIYRKILEVLTIYTEEGVPIAVSIKLNAALGMTAGDNVITQIAYVNVCRLDGDVVTLLHSEVDTIITVPVRTVYE